MNPNEMLSSNYSLAQMTITNQPLSQPNLPTEQYQIENLTYLADMKQRLDSEIGPSTLISAFRTKELQEALAAQGEPTGSGAMSFHEVGRAMDITPTTMSIADFFGRLLANEDLRLQFAEIAIKPSQNAIHLAINVPGDERTPKITGLNSEGVYARLSLDEITSYIEPYMQSAAAAYDYAAAQLVTWNKTPLILSMVAAMGGLLYLAFAKGKSRWKTNPRLRFRKALYKPHSNKDELHKLKAEKVAKAYQRGVNLDDIVDQFGINKTSIFKYLKETKTKKLGGQGRTPSVNRDELIADYRAGISLNKIAKKYGITKEYIYKFLVGVKKRGGQGPRKKSRRK